jgi:hypothetical protein
MHIALWTVLFGLLQLLAEWVRMLLSLDTAHQT